MLSRDFTSEDLFSSPTMSMHSSTHSLQMNTVVPAISLRTSCWLFPQNVQWSVFLESLPPALFISVPQLDASRRGRCPAGQTTDMLLRRSFSALRRCRLFGPRISARPTQAECEATLEPLARHMP